MHILFPFKSVCASFVDLRPFGVISLEQARRRQAIDERKEAYRLDVLLCNVVENHIYRENIMYGVLMTSWGDRRTY